jgi:hypothetical protein
MFRSDNIETGANFACFDGSPLKVTVWSKLFRFAALALLLSAAVDLIAVDMLGVLWQDKQTVQSELQGSCSQDDCFCCSASTIPCTRVVMEPHYTVIPTDETAKLFVPSRSPDPPLLPPRA